MDKVLAFVCLLAIFVAANGLIDTKQHILILAFWFLLGLAATAVLVLYALPQIFTGASAFGALLL